MIPGKFLGCILLLEFYQRFQEFLEFRDFCPIIAPRKAACVPLHYGHFIVQWVTAIEIKSLNNVKLGIEGK